MKVIKDLQDWKAYRSTISSTVSLGLVATMGCLHQGHASLLQRSKQENELSLLSIFVNPTQFNDPKDYDRYPITEQADLELAQAMGVDCVLMPKKDSMYPAEHAISCSTTQPLSQLMEGFYRPGHFNGMLTIVLKLLILTRPTKAYFGEKDYQQYRLIESLAQNFLLDTQIIGCPTIREEKTGLAMSSRNTLLNPEERKMAEYFAQIFQQTHNHNIDQSKNSLKQMGIEVEYIEAYQERILAAVRVGRVRLIDNHSL